MKVSLQAIGDLRDYFGREPAVFDLPDRAVFQDILDIVDVRWGVGLPSYLWSREARKFKGPVLLVVDKKAVQDLQGSLSDGMKISILKASAGG